MVPAPQPSDVKRFSSCCNYIQWKGFEEFPILKEETSKILKPFRQFLNLSIKVVKWLRAQNIVRGRTEPNPGTRANQLEMWKVEL
jgi:hypothetical protein